MSKQIGTGQSNKVPGTIYATVQATAATIAKGDIVALSGETGYTVIKCTNVMTPVGVAAEDFAASGWGKIITRGFCNYLTCTATNIVDGDLLYCDANSDAAGVTVGDDLGVEVGAIIGVALQAQTGTTITAAYISPAIQLV